MAMTKRERLQNKLDKANHLHRQTRYAEANLAFNNLVKEMLPPAPKKKK